ncbi:MAG TPA: hypothetical protein VFU23_16115, partial [Gemmatimonadales bacterium]|nr:hypothetical protein [Gemmatimonadales bacterium]
MVIAPMPEGSVLPLVREVTGSPDPLALYAALTDGGTRPGTFLLESGETGAGSGERSLLGVSPALRITCNGRMATITGLSANGRSLLGWTAQRLEPLARVSHEGDTVTAVFPEPPAGPRDEAARGRLPSPLDALRTVV